MAINAYVGLQGSGKSFEFVSGPMLDAVAAGRRVVTNVAGINQQFVHDYLVEKRGCTPEKLGAIVHIINARISEPQFFPDEEKPELETVVQGGDLVAVDEAWRFWGADEGKLSHEHMQFFRMHRHYVHPESKVSCDVVLMTQDITGLHRSVKNVIEFAFKMHKLKSLGFDKRYRVEIYEGWKLNPKTRISDRQKRYDKEIFPLYQSYTGGQGAESAIDARQNIFANKILWFYLVGTMLFLIVGGWQAWRFFHRGPEPSPASKSAAAAPNARPAADVASSPTVNVSPAKATNSERWRYAGEFQAHGTRWVIVADSVGRLRVESPAVFTGSGLAAVGDVEGERVAGWTGVLVGKGTAGSTPPPVQVPEVSK